MEFVVGETYKSESGSFATCVGHRTDGLPILELAKDGQIFVLKSEGFSSWHWIGLPSGWRMMNTSYKDSMGEYRHIGYLIPWNEDSMMAGHLHWGITDADNHLKAFRAGSSRRKPPMPKKK